MAPHANIVSVAMLPLPSIGNKLGCTLCRNGINAWHVENVSSHQENLLSMQIDEGEVEIPEA